MAGILGQNINSYQRKLVYLTLGSLVLIILMYTLALKRTFQLKKECKHLEQQLLVADDAPEQINSLKQKLVHIDQLIGANINENYVLKEQILNYSGTYCNKHNLVIKDFPAIHEYTQENYQVETSKIIIQGGFIDILKLIYLFETEYKIARVVSVDFHSEKNIRTKQKVLEADIYFQNINISNNE